MKDQNKTSRRKMIRHGVLGAAALTTSNLLCNSAIDPSPSKYDGQELEFAGRVAFA